MAKYHPATTLSTPRYIQDGFAVKVESFDRLRPPAFALGISERDVRRLVVDPWRNGRPLVLDGQTFEPNTYRIEIRPCPVVLDPGDLALSFSTLNEGPVTDRFLVPITTDGGDVGPATDHRDDREDTADLRDVFIAHASEDKDAVARPLYERLVAGGYSVWFDEVELVVGSSLSETIDRGLATSRFGAVVLSRSFFEKEWPRRELQGLVAKEVTGGARVILPIWHGVDKQFVTAESPPLADVLGVSTDRGTDHVAAQIIRAIEHRQGLERARGSARPARRAPDEPLDPEEAAATELQDLRDELVELLRAKDEVGTREMLRTERRSFDSNVTRTLAAAADEMGREVDTQALAALEATLWHLIERRIATLFPLVEYAEDQLEDELQNLVALVDRRLPTRSGLPLWRGATRVPGWHVVHLLGAFAAAEERWRVVRMLWDVRTSDGQPLAALHLGDSARLADALVRARPHTSVTSRAKPLWHLAFRVAGSEFLVERYPELVRAPGQDDPVLSCLARIGDFSWLVTALAGKNGVDLDQWWRAGQVHPTLPSRIRVDTKVATALSSALFDYDAWFFEAEVDDWVESAGGRRNWA